MSTLTNWRLVGKDGSQDVYATVTAETLEQATALVVKESWGFKLTQGFAMGPACVPQVLSLHKTTPGRSKHF